MPTYSFKDKNTGEVFDKFMSISSFENYLKENPNLESYISSAPPIGDTVRMGLKKPDDGFRDILRNIKHKHYGSKVNTF